MQARIRKISEEDEEKCQDAASFIFGLIEHPISLGERNFFSATSLSSQVNTFRQMRWLIGLYENKDSIEELKRVIRTCIVNKSRKNQHTINAALIIFNLFDAIRKNPNTDFYEELVNAMWDPKLKLKYANNLFCLCYKDKFYTHVKEQDRYYLSQLFLPNLKSFKWQEAVTKIREIVMLKLHAEMETLKSSDAIYLLETAKNMPIFSEHTSSLIITGAYGQTNPLIEIDNMLLNKKSGGMNFTN